MFQEANSSYFLWAELVKISDFDVFKEILVCNTSHHLSLFVYLVIVKSIKALILKTNPDAHKSPDMADY